MSDTEQKSDLQVMVSHFEALRTDIFEGVLQTAQRLERTEDKVLNIEAERLADRVFVQDVRDSLRKWETKIPELVHGAVKECMSFEISELKEKLDDHIKSDNPHPVAKRSKQENRRRLMELVALFVGGGGLVMIVQLVLAACGVKI